MLCSKNDGLRAAVAVYKSYIQKEHGKNNEAVRKGLVSGDDGGGLRCSMTLNLPLFPATPFMNGSTKCAEP